MSGTPVSNDASGGFFGGFLDFLGDAAQTAVDVAGAAQGVSNAYDNLVHGPNSNPTAGTGAPGGLQAPPAPSGPGFGGSAAEQSGAAGFDWKPVVVIGGIAFAGIALLMLLK
jgi:hypothetical protein